jgi:putative cell wall-binding protein
VSFLLRRSRPRRAVLSGIVVAAVVLPVLPTAAAPAPEDQSYVVRRPESNVFADVPATSLPMPDAPTRATRVPLAGAVADGAPFGACGVVVLGDGDIYGLAVDALPLLSRSDGGVIVPIVEGGELHLHALDGLGRVDTGYGAAGVASVPFDGTVGWGPTPAVVVAAEPEGDVTVVAEDGEDRLWVQSFGADGTARPATSLDRGDGDDVVAAIPGGTGVLVVVWTFDAGTEVVRLVDGEPDPTYGAGGAAALPFQATRAAGTPDGGIVVTNDGEDVARLTPTGALDPTFGTDGVATAPLAGFGRSLAVGPDGSVWMALAEGGTVRVARMTPDGDGGPAPVALAEPLSGGRLPGITVAADGTAVVAYDLPSGNDYRRKQIAVGLRPDLTVDPRFGRNGEFRWEEDATEFTAVATDPAGRVLVQSGPIVRRFANGQLDGPCPDGDLGAVRFAGANRFDTAAKLSAGHFPDADVVYVATGEQFPDALAGGPVAALDRAPLLLVTQTTVPPETAAEIQRLAPERIVLLGGTGPVSPAVEAALATFAPVTRIAGANRYDTAARLAIANFPPQIDRVYLATGEAFPDALAVGPFAGARRVPILLTHPAALPGPTADALQRLSPTEIVIVGGVGAVSAQVAADVQSQFPGTSVIRIDGSDRFNTARSLMMYEGYGSPYASYLDDPIHDIVHLATGFAFPDALAAGPIAALEGAALLLTHKDQLTETARDALALAAPQRITVLGGAGAVAEAVSNRLTVAQVAHRFLDYSPEGVPLGWDRCKSVSWVFNPADAPDANAAEAMLEQAFQRIGEVTGIDFRYEGRVSEPLPNSQPGYDRGPYVDGYGNRWAPVLVGWGTPFSGGAVGEAGAMAVSYDGYVSGTIVFAKDETSFPLDFSEVSWGMVALHEIGHLVGLDHVPSPQVMYPAIGRFPLTDLTPADRLGMQIATGSGCRNTPAGPTGYWW